jgi:hypothetical protein
LTVGSVFTGLAGSIIFNSGTINVVNQNMLLGQTVLLPATSNIAAGRNFIVSNDVTIPFGADLTLSGGRLTAQTLLLLGGAPDSGGVGVLNLNSGTVSTSQRIRVQDGARINYNGGTLKTTGTLELAGGGEVIVSGAASNHVLQIGAATID